jgi:hypothetical protein
MSAAPCSYRGHGRRLASAAPGAGGPAGGGSCTHVSSDAYDAAGRADPAPPAGPDLRGLASSCGAFNASQGGGQRAGSSRWKRSGGCARVRQQQQRLTALPVRTLSSSWYQSGCRRKAGRLSATSFMSQSALRGSRQQSCVHTSHHASTYPIPHLWKTG